MKKLINLQLMAEGGAGTAAPSAEGGAATGVQGDSPVSQNGEDLNVRCSGRRRRDDRRFDRRIDSD